MMPLSGKEFRRISAQARSLSPGESRKLIDRILPLNGEVPAHTLRIETQADREAAPVAIFAAVNADEITWDEAEKLLSEVENAPALEPAEQADTSVDWDAWTANLLRVLAEADQLNNRTGRGPSSEEPVPLAPCSAAKEGGELVNINENTSAEPQRNAEEPEA